MAVEKYTDEATGKEYWHDTETGRVWWAEEWADGGGCALSSSSASRRDVGRQMVRASRDPQVMNDKQRRKSVRRTLKKLAAIAESSGLNANYGNMIMDWSSQSLYARGSDGAYEANIKCVMCKIETVSHIFFPCQHKCVCHACLRKLNIGSRGDHIDDAETAVRPKDPWLSCAICM